MTQWVVFSIFATASATVLVLSLSQDNRLIGVLVRVLAIMIYWLGYLLYNRYRGLNIQVAKYLVELEQENGFKLQQHLDTQFHARGFSTRKILSVAGILYLVFAIIISIV